MRRMNRLGILSILVGIGFLISAYLRNFEIAFALFGLILAIITAIEFYLRNLLGFFWTILALVTEIITFLFFGNTPFSIFSKVALALTIFGTAYICIGIFFFYEKRKYSGWAYFTGWSIVISSIPFFTSDLTVLSFILWNCLGIGTGLLIWGLIKRLIGLIIAGCLVATSGFGVYTAWRQAFTPNGLTETGMMLVWFGLGWGTITIFSRLRLAKSIYWPLIPGGIMGVVGWGLYSGGDPNNALSFIGNTGSLAVLIFGLYFLLMRRGIRR